MTTDLNSLRDAMAEARDLILSGLELDAAVSSAADEFEVHPALLLRKLSEQHGVAPELLADALRARAESAGRQPTMAEFRAMEARAKAAEEAAAAAPRTRRELSPDEELNRALRSLVRLYSRELRGAR